MYKRQLFGSLERFTGILIEHYAGHLPFWLSPLQAVVATITSDTDEYAYEVQKALVSKGIRAEIDTRNEKIGYKIREHSNSKVPAIIDVGKKEAQDKKVSVRRIGSSETKTFKLEDIVTSLSKEAKSPIE